MWRLCAWSGSLMVYLWNALSVELPHYCIFCSKFESASFWIRVSVELAHLNLLKLLCPPSTLSLNSRFCSGALPHFTVACVLRAESFILRGIYWIRSSSISANARQDLSIAQYRDSLALLNLKLPYLELVRMWGWLSCVVKRKVDGARLTWGPCWFGLGFLLGTMVTELALRHWGDLR